MTVNEAYRSVVAIVTRVEIGRCCGPGVPEALCAVDPEDSSAAAASADAVMRMGDAVARLWTRLTAGSFQLRAA